MSAAFWNDKGFWHALGCTVAVTVMVGVLGLAAVEGLEREERRLEIVRQHNCKNYGDAMNKWAAERHPSRPAPCPPTPQG